MRQALCRISRYTTHLGHDEPRDVDGNLAHQGSEYDTVFAVAGYSHCGQNGEISEAIHGAGFHFNAVNSVDKAQVRSLDGEADHHGHGGGGDIFVPV